ncbi:MAG TPA: monothiol bacilliredoxin BrxC family protein, partial [Pyrinomonadaceae bacterium]|nr:monothiol bacilliredoxin BrxC family protein [Pyrinomonadaceae bacterium]
MANVILVDSKEKLESFFQKSYTRPVALLKHSNSCGISAHILSQFDEIDGDIHLLVIQETRGLSALVAERT